MPCKLKNHQYKDPVAKPPTEKKHARIADAHESTRKRLEETLSKDHDDHIAEKGFHSLSHHNLVHKFVPMLQAIKNLDATAAVGDIVKDDSGSKAVFTEQGSSASQMKAAKVMDVIARPPDFAGQAADAVPAYTGKYERRSEIAEKSRVMMSTTTEVWANIQDPLVLLERQSEWSPTRRPLVGETMGKVPLGLGWENDDYIAEEGTILCVIIILCSNLFQCPRQ